MIRRPKRTSTLTKEEAMLAEILLTAWLASPSPCFITGEVFHQQTEAKAMLSTNCPIHFMRQGALITMTSPKWIVQVTIPEEPVAQAFIYRWGQAEARIGNRVVQVSYGPAGGV
jgi:hypothetical protein